MTAPTPPPLDPAVAPLPASGEYSWVPDPAVKPGTPVGSPLSPGSRGERGSSAFDGGPQQNADGTIPYGAVPATHYPLHGVEYYATDPGRRRITTAAPGNRPA